MRLDAPNFSCNFAVNFIKTAIMKTKTATAAKAKAATPAKAKKEKKDGSWYMDERGIKIPLDEYFKDDPPYTGPSRTEMLKAKGLFPYIEIVDMRAVMK
jgi:hypothetical protein